MMALALTKLNKANKDFWELEGQKLEKRMDNPALREAAFARLASEFRRRVPVQNQMTLESALEEEEQAFSKRADLVEPFVVSRRARRAGSAKKVDALQGFIVSVVRCRRTIKVSELLEKIRAEAGSGRPIEGVAAGCIEFVGANHRSRSSPISGLKDRLSRAKAMLRSVT
jgi:hypothetical protein